MKLSLKRALATLIAIVLVLTVVVVLRTALITSKQIAAEEADPLKFVVAEAAQRLAGAIRYQTISYQEGTGDGTAFLRLHQYLEEAFPRVHAALTREVVGDFSLLYTWQGSAEGLEPIILISHMDVVPAETGAESDWTHPPFAGRIADGFVWGRGSLDVKLAMTGALEAIEALLAEDFAPRRTVYLAIGHDEEVGGQDGAAKIAALLGERRVRAAFTLDEGSAIVTGVVPGLKKPVALVALAEKGFLTVELKATGEGGHSSRPRHPTTVGKLARAIHRLETHLMPAELRPPASGIFDYLASEMPLGMRVVVANRWLFNPLLVSRLEGGPATNAVIRTTTTPTQLAKAGVKENVIPREASAIVNFRILPGDTIQEVLDHVERTIDDADVTVRATGEGREPSPISDAESPAFEALHRTIRQVFPDVVVAPSLVIAGTDSKHYERIAENSFRFTPMRLDKDDLKRIHGRDERIGVEDYGDIVRFYGQLLRNSATR